MEIAKLINYVLNHFSKLKAHPFYPGLCAVLLYGWPHFLRA